MPHMPDKPDTWAIALARLSQHSPTIYAATLSFLMAALRIIYGGGTRRQAMLEATICMLLTTSMIAVLEYFGLPSSLALLWGKLLFVIVAICYSAAQIYGGIYEKGRCRNASWRRFCLGLYYPCR